MCLLFTSQTCLELVDCLNAAQTTRELSRRIPSHELNNTIDKHFALRTLYILTFTECPQTLGMSSKRIVLNMIALSILIGKLTSSISRRNEKLETELDRLTCRIEEAHNLLPQPTKKQ